MNEREFLQWLIDNPVEKGTRTVAIMKPGPTRFVLNDGDALAARLLIWMEEELLPVNATLGDLLDVLDSARFWTLFWGGLDKGEQP